MTTDSFFTVDELASRWGCGRKSVIEAIKEGRLAAFRVGKRTYRIAAAEIERFEMARAS